MTDLLERLEVAAAGSRELDGLIYGLEHKLTLNGCTFMLDINGAETFQFRHPTKMHPGGPAALYVSGYDVAPVTTSTDAAVALADRVLPDETFWNVSHHAIISGKKMFNAEVWPPVNTVDQPDFYGHAAAPALALCAAIIRAHAEQVRG